MGENDAWLVATADALDADVVGSDRAAFERLGPRYLRFSGRLPPIVPQNRTPRDIRNVRGTW